MKSIKMTFQQIAEILTEAKIPCILKQYRYENGDTNFSIEFGFNWPEHLVDDVDAAFGGRTPSYVDLCGDSCGPDMIAKKSIAGGPKNYISAQVWG